MDYSEGQKAASRRDDETSREKPRELARSGDLIGPYAIITQLASGDFTTVHLAQKHGAQGFYRLAAIKRLKSAYAEKAEWSQLLLDEARLSSGVSHANIVDVIDVGTDAGCYMVMDYIEGADLEVLLARAGKERHARYVVPPIVDALHGLHTIHTASDELGESLAMVHQAPRARHILVGIDGTARITDFSQVAARGLIPSSLRGERLVPGYMAPEQVLGEPLSARTDLFIVGITLWEALTGERLFRAETPELSRRAVLEHHVPRPSEVGLKPPACFDDVCLRALQRNPELRYADALEMARDLRDAALSESIYATSGELGQWVRALAGRVLIERRRAIGADAPSLEITVEEVEEVEASDFPSASLALQVGGESDAARRRGPPRLPVRTEPVLVESDPIPGSTTVVLRPPSAPTVEASLPSEAPDGAEPVAPPDLEDVVAEVEAEVLAADVPAPAPSSEEVPVITAVPIAVVLGPKPIGTQPPPPPSFATRPPAPPPFATQPPPPPPAAAPAVHVTRAHTVKVAAPPSSGRQPPAGLPPPSVTLLGISPRGGVGSRTANVTSGWPGPRRDVPRSSAPVAPVAHGHVTPHRRGRATLPEGSRLREAGPQLPSPSSVRDELLRSGNVPLDLNDPLRPGTFPPRVGTIPPPPQPGTFPPPHPGTVPPPVPRGGTVPPSTVASPVVALGGMPELERFDVTPPTEQPISSPSHARAERPVGSGRPQPRLFATDSGQGRDDATYALLDRDEPVRSSGLLGIVSVVLSGIIVVAGVVGYRQWSAERTAPQAVTIERTAKGEAPAPAPSTEPIVTQGTSARTAEPPPPVAPAERAVTRPAPAQAAPAAKAGSGDSAAMAQLGAAARRAEPAPAAPAPPREPASGAAPSAPAKLGASGPRPEAASAGNPVQSESASAASAVRPRPSPGATAAAEPATSGFPPRPVAAPARPAKPPAVRSEPAAVAPPVEAPVPPPARAVLGRAQGVPDNPYLPENPY